MQLGSAIHHGETSALYNSGRLPARAYQGSTMYTTLSPCDMCRPPSPRIRIKHRGKIMEGTPLTILIENQAQGPVSSMVLAASS